MTKVTIDEELTHAFVAQTLEDCGGNLELAAKILAATALWHMAKVEDLTARLPFTQQQPTEEIQS